MNNTPADQNISSEKILPVLNSLPFLDGVENELLIELAKNAQILSFTQGQPLSRRHSRQRQLLLVLKGEVRLVVFSDHLAHNVGTLERLGPGQMLGWSELLELKQEESALASKDTSVLAIPLDDIRKLINVSNIVRNRIFNSLPSSSLFYVLEGWIENCPIELGNDIPEICRILKSTARLHRINCKEFTNNRKLPEDRRWFVINGDTNNWNRVC